jgi:hypothetical protein
VELLQRDARAISVVTRAEQSPTPGERLTRYDIQGMDEHEFITAFGHDPWEVAEVVPIEDRPGWVKVYVQPVEPILASWGEAGILPR